MLTKISKLNIIIVDNNAAQISTTWEQVNATLEMKYGRFKKLNMVPLDKDIDLVVKFVSDTNDEDENFLGGLWIKKFYDHRDKYGQRDVPQRPRKDPKSTSTQKMDEIDDDDEDPKNKRKSKEVMQSDDSEEDDDELTLTQRSRKKAK
jgi:hypothetical protein